MATVQENLPQPTNPLGVCGVEFIEYATSQPQALGALLQQFGFSPVARHRSREITLYQWGTLNIVVNAAPSLSGQAAPAVPTLTAMALRVANAAQAHAAACHLGAWDIPTRASAMELNIPGIHGAGDSLIYFTDRFAGNHGATLSIYDVDFVPLPATAPAVLDCPAVQFFGVVQAVHAGRTADWVDFYCHLLSFAPIADVQHGGFSGVLRKGVVLQSPCKTFHIQLIEPPEGADDIVWEEGLIRLGLGCTDVPALTAALQARGVAFVDVGAVRPSDHGAVSHTYLGGVTIELVKQTQHVKQGAA